MPVQNDPSARSELYGLLGRTWPRLNAAIPQSAEWGAAWERLSIAFVEWGDDDRALSHVGLMPVVGRAAGQRLGIGAIHAVCTDADHRGRGLATALLRQALAHCERQGWTTQVLFAVDPEFYLRLGFRPVVPSVALPPRLRPASSPGVSLRLDPRIPADFEAVQRRLAVRRSTSGFDIEAPVGLFWLDFALAGGLIELLEIRSLDVVVAVRRDEGLLRIVDVIGATRPTLRSVLDHLPGRWTDVVLDCSPELLSPSDSASFRFEPALIGDVMMVRGPWPLADQSFSMAPLWRW